MSKSAYLLLILVTACSTSPASREPVAQAAAEAASEASAEAVSELSAIPDVPLEPADRIIYMVITDRYRNGNPANDGSRSDPAGLLTWHGGDFQGLTERFAYLEGLGVNTLWITPIVEQIAHSVDWEGNPHWGYHGYWAERFDVLEPRLGTPDDLRALLDGAHDRGLDVLLDVVLNHPGYQSHFAEDRAWTRQCVEEWTNDLTQCLFGLPDFLTEDPQVAAQIVEWQVNWFREYPFDGLRADTVKHVETEVWREFLAAVRALRPTDPTFFALGEWWGTAPRADDPMLASGMFDAMYDFEFDALVEGFLNNRMRAEAMGHHLARRNDLALGRYVHYLNTHDTALMTGRLENDAAYPLALVLLMTTAGIPLLYYGDEVARPGTAWPNNRPDMPWELTDPPSEMLQLTRELTRLRREHPALTRGSHEEIQAGNGLVAFGRTHGDDRLVVAVNRGPDVAVMDCPDPASCEPLICVGCRAGATVELDAFGAVVLPGAP